MSCLTPASVVGAACRRSLARRAKQHCHGVAGAKAFGIGLGCDLETAQVRRQKQHTRTPHLRRLDVLGATPLHTHRAAQPQPWQLGHQLAGLAHRTQRNACRVPRLIRMSQQAAAVAAGEHKAGPAQRPAQRMQRRQRQPAQGAKKEVDQRGQGGVGGRGGAQTLV